MFDSINSPIFWVIAIWWLLTALFGKRLKRLQALRQPPQQQPEPVEPQTFAGSDDTYTDPAASHEPAAPVEPVQPAMPPTLVNLMRGMGLIEEVAFPPPAEPEPAVELEPEIVAAPVTTQPEPPRIRPARAEHPGALPALRILSPWQQAVVLRELLDEPLALRRSKF